MALESILFANSKVGIPSFRPSIFCWFSTNKGRAGRRSTLSIIYGDTMHLYEVHLRTVRGMLDVILFFVELYYSRIG